MNRRRKIHVRVALELTALTVVCLAADIALAELLHASAEDFLESIAMSVVLGIFIGQINLISIWAALAPGPIVVRLPWSILLAMAMWITLLIGIRLSGDFTAASYYQSGIILCGSQLIAQVPLWLGSRVWGWRLATRRQIQEGRQFSGSQFGLQSLMLGTLLLAVALAILRWTLSGRQLDWSQAFPDKEIFFLLAVAVVTNLIVVVPCIGWAFSPWSRMRQTLMWWSLLVFVVSLIEIATLTSLLGPPSRERLMTIVVAVLINLSQCGMVLIALFVIRRLGVRLVRFRV